MTRGQYILHRLAQLVPVILIITVIVFLMLRLIPGDPVTAVVGERATDEEIARVRGAMGLDEPIWLQYFYYMRDLVQFDFGESLTYDVPVSELLTRRFSVTISLALATTVLTNLIAIPLGILAALKKDSLLDNVVRTLLVVTMVMPPFWSGILLIIFFSIRLGIFPVSGFGEGFVDNLHHLVLPALTIALGLAPILIRSLRTSILETLQMDYVKTARAKGVEEQSVIRIHVLRNALVPYVTLLGAHVAFLMAGTVIIEKVFAIPGAGALLVDSVSARDYPVVQSLTLLFAFLVIGVNLFTDILYSFLDPRVRY